MQRTPTAFGASLSSLAFARVDRVAVAVRLAAAPMRAHSYDPLVDDPAGQAMLVARRPAE